MTQRPPTTMSVFRAPLALAQRLLVAALCCVLPLSAGGAQTARTWTGLGANTSWQTAGNWSGGVAPVANDTLIFGAAGVAVRPVANNNFPVGTNFGAILITSGGYSLTGNAVVIGGVVRASHSTGTTAISLVIGGAAAVEMTGAGTLSLSGANTFTGGVAIRAGTVFGSTTATAFGAPSGAITLGHTSGTDNATLRVGFAGAMAHPIVVPAGSSGNSLSITNAANATLTGPIVINRDVVFAPALTSSLVISGGITGTGDVRVAGTGTTAAITFSTNPLNFTGRFSNQGTNAGTTTISGGVGANVREIALESNTSPLSVATQPIVVGAAGKTLVSTSTARLFSITSGTTGTGDVVVSHNGTFANGISLSTGAINHTGALRNTGTGTAGTLLSAPLGAALLGVVQNSATSSLTLSGTNTAYAGPVSLLAGNLRLGSATALGGAGSTTGTGGTLTIAAGTTLDASAATTITTRNAQIWQGDFTLGGALALNTGPGAITVSSSTLTVRSGTGTTALVTVPGVISGTSNLTVEVRGSLGFTFSGALSIAGTLTHSGSGAGTTTFTGGIASSVTAISQSSNTAALTVSTLPITVNAAGTTFSTTSTTRLFSITGGIVGTGEVRLNNNGPLANGITIATTAVNPTGALINSGTGTGATLVSAPLGANVSAVTQNSVSSALVLSGVNTPYRGTTTVAAGDLRLGSPTALGGNGTTTGTGGGVIVAAGTTLSSNGSVTITTRNAYTWQGDFTLGGPSPLNLGPGAITIVPPNIIVSSGTGATGLVTIPGIVNGTTNLTLQQRGSNGFTFNGSQNTSGAISVIGTGTGTTTFSGGISAAITSITQQSNTAPLVISTLPITVGAAGKTLQTQSTGSTFTVTGGIAGTGNVTLTNDGTVAGGLLVSSGTVNFAGTLTHTGSGSGTTVISAPIAVNVSAITQSSATSALTLSGANTAYRGTTTLAAGRLRVGSSTALGGNGSTTGTGGALLIAAGTTFDASAPVVLTTRNAQSWQGDFTLGGEFALTTGPGLITVTGPARQVSTATGTTALVTIASPVSGTVDLTTRVLGSSGFDFTGPLSLTGTLQNIGTGTGTTAYTSGLPSTISAVDQSSTSSALILRGNNSAYAGTTRVNQGTLLLGSPTALGGGGSPTGTGGALILGAGATIDAIAALTLTTANPTTWNGDVNYGGTADLTLGPAPVTLAAAATTLSSSAGGVGRLTIPSTITGTSDLTIAPQGASGVTLAGAINVQGALANAGTGSASTIITGTLATSIPEIVQRSATSIFAINTPLTTTASGLTLRNTALSGVSPLRVANGVTGTGNLTLANDGAVNGGIEITGAPIALTGAVRNTGAGAGSVVVSAELESAVQSVQQLSATSPLELSAANVQFSGTVNAQAGVLRATSSSALGDGSSNNQFVFAGGTLQALGNIASPSSRPFVLNGPGGFDANGFSILIDGAIGGAGGLTSSGTGSLTLTGAATIGGDFTIASGTLVAPTTNSFSVAGQWTNNGTFTHNGGSVTFTGTTPQTIGGTSTTTFGGLTVNSAGLIIGTSPIIDRVLTFMSGKITTGTQRVILHASAVVSSASASAYVHGTLERYIANTTAPTVRFDVGDATVYAPVTLSFAGSTTGTGSVSVSTTAGDHPNLAASGANPALSLNRYWSVVNSGVGGFSSYTGTFNFVPGDIDAGTNPLRLIVRQRSGSVWSVPTFDSRTATSIRATGLTTFGDFAMAEQFVGSANAAMSTLIPGSATIPADGISSQLLTVVTRDAAGLPLSVGGATVTISLIGGTGTVGPVIDLGNGSYTARVTAPLVIGNGVFGATVNGVDVRSGSPLPTRVTIAYGTGFARGAYSRLIPDSAILLANGRSTQRITVTAFDAQGNRIERGGAPVFISLIEGTGRVGPVTDEGNGTYTAIVTAPTRVGFGDFIARIDGDTVRGGLATISRAHLTYVTGPISGAGSTLTPTTATLLADGLDRQRLIVTVNDSTGNPIGIGGATVAIVRTSGIGTISAVVDKGDGTYEAEVTAPSVVGSGTFTASVNGQAVLSGGVSATQVTIQYVRGVARRYVVRSETAQPVVGSTTIFTAQLAGANGDAVAEGGVRVTWRVVSGRGAFEESSSITDNNGVARAVFSNDTVAGVSVIVSASDTIGREGTSSALSTRADRPSSERSSARIPETAATGTTTPIDVTLRDRYGNRVAMSADSVLLVVRGVNAGTRVAATGDDAGSYRLLYSSARAGSDTLTVSVGGVVIAGPTAVMVSTPVPMVTLSISSSVSDPALGDTVTIVMTVTNPGTGAATDVQVVNEIPMERFTMLSLVVSHGAYSAATLRWEIATLAPGATATLTFKGVVRLPPPA